MTYMLCLFIFKQFEEWKFFLSGVGLFPQPLEIERITSYLQQLASLAIIFKNPTNEHVLIDVILTSKLFFLYFTYVIL